MKIVVIGGTGLIGSKTVAALTTRGHQVAGVAPSTGVDTYTGAGLAEALTGAEVVIDLANSPSFEDEPAMDFFQTAGRNLLAAGRAAGVRHHIALSVVGTAKLQGSGYFRAKQVQEDLIRAAGLPYTIIHSTQFMEFIGVIARSATVGDEVRLSPALLQPILSDDVAAAGDARRVVNDPQAGYFGVLLKDGDLVPEGVMRLAPTSFDTYIARGEFRL